MQFFGMSEPISKTKYREIIFVKNVTSKNVRKTSDRMTLYEKAAVLGEREIQLRMGTEPRVEVGSTFDFADIARRELEAHLLDDMVIVRNLPNGETEEVIVSELRL